MPTALLIDDETKSRQILRLLLEEYCPQVSILGEAGTFREAYRLIQELQPELVFLDIQLNAMEGTGLDLAALNEGRRFEIIFISGSREHAVEAFRVNAADYLVKPIGIKELKEAVSRVEEKWSAKSQGKKNQGGALQLPTTTGFLMLSQDEILYIEAQAAYSQLITIDNRNNRLVSKNIGELESSLDPELFFRSHKSYIISRRHLREYQRGEGGFAIMSDGKAIPVSRTAKESFLEWLKNG